MRILELENRCTGNRTVGSNPTLSAISLIHLLIFRGFVYVWENFTHVAAYEAIEDHRRRKHSGAAGLNESS